jgi:hypothetical protein
VTARLGAGAAVTPTRLELESTALLRRAIDARRWRAEPIPRERRPLREAASESGRTERRIHAEGALEGGPYAPSFESVETLTA